MANRPPCRRDIAITAEQIRFLAELADKEGSTFLPAAADNLGMGHQRSPMASSAPSRPLQLISWIGQKVCSSVTASQYLPVSIEQCSGKTQRRRFRKLY